MYSAYMKNMSMANKLNLSLAGKTVMENISLTLFTKRRGAIALDALSAGEHAINFRCDFASVRILLEDKEDSVVVGCSCQLADDADRQPDWLSSDCAVMIEFSAPPATLSFANGRQFHFSGFHTIPPETENALAMCDGGYLHYMALDGDNYRSRLRGMGTHVALTCHIGCDGYNRLQGQLLSIHFGKDPIAVIRENQAANGRVAQTCTPQLWLDGIGQSEQKILQLVRQCELTGVACHHLVTDPLKSDVSLTDLVTDTARFPDFTQLTHTLRQSYRCDCMAVQPFALAKRGVANQSKAALTFDGNLLPTHGDYALLSPKETRAACGYQTILTHLKQLGVHSVLWQGLDSAAALCEGYESPVFARRAYRSAAEKATAAVFDQSCLTIEDADVLSLCYRFSTQRPLPAIIRYRSCTEHRVLAALCNVGAMFGGDLPQLTPLVDDSGALLCCAEPPVVARRNLFSDPTTDGKPLRLCNCDSGVGVMGVFNVSQTGGTVRGDLCADDIDGLHGNRFVCRLVLQNKLMVVNRDQRIAVTLNKGQSELAIFTPIISGVALLGDINKWLAHRAVVKTGEGYTAAPGATIALYADRPLSTDLAFEKQGNLYLARCDSGSFTLSASS